MFITQIKFMQMFEYEDLYNTKIFGKTSHIRRWKYLQQYAPCSKVKMTPPKKNIYTVFSFLFNPVKFQEGNYSSQLFDISLFKDI